MEANDFDLKLRSERTPTHSIVERLRRLSRHYRVRPENREPPNHPNVPLDHTLCLAADLIEELWLTRTVLVEALENLENDDGHMPASAWNLVQDAVTRAGGKRKT